MTYVLDKTAREPDFNLVGMPFTPNSHAPAHDSATGQQIYGFLTSRIGVALLIGSVIAAPSRPPVIATEPFLAKIIGEDAFTDEMKKYTGRVVRFIIEHLGGAWVRRGVKVTVESRYGSGSIYTLRDLAIEVAA